MPQGIIKNVNAPPACVICCAATHNLHQLTTHHRLLHYTLYRTLDMSGSNLGKFCGAGGKGAAHSHS